MKKPKFIFLLFCLCLAMLSLISIPKLVFNFQVSDDITYFFYAQTTNAKIDADVVDCGGTSIVKCDISNAQKIKGQLKCIQGESIRVNNCSAKTKFEILNKYKKNVVMQESVENMDIYYCFDNTLPRFVNINGKKVNVQIAISKNEINIGYPLILNGY